MDDIPWKTLWCAYGNSIQVPCFIRELESDDDDLASEAVAEGLWSYITHQYTVYPVTAYAIPFVAKTLLNPKTKYKRDIVNFLRTCAEQDQQCPYEPLHFKIFRKLRGITLRDIKTELISCREIIRLFLQDKNDDLREDAVWLDRYCTRQDPQ